MHKLKFLLAVVGEHSQHFGKTDALAIQGNRPWCLLGFQTPISDFEKQVRDQKDEERNLLWKHDIQRPHRQDFHRLPPELVLPSDIYDTGRGQEIYTLRLMIYSIKTKVRITLYTSRRAFVITIDFILLI